MVVHEEHYCTTFVAQSHPLCSTIAEKPLPVLRHHLVPSGNQSPARCSESHAQTVISLEGCVLRLKVCITKNPHRIFTFLKAHEVVRSGLPRMPNEFPCTAVVPMPLLEEVPPPKVVRQHLDEYLGTRCVRLPKSLWLDAVLTPQILHQRDLILGVLLCLRVGVSTADQGCCKQCNTGHRRESAYPQAPCTPALLAPAVQCSLQHFLCTCRCWHKLCIP